MTKISFSLAQMQVLLGQPQANYESAAHYIEQAANCGSQFLLLPELWSSGYDLPNRDLYAQENTALLQRMARLAREYCIWIGGSLIQEKAGNYYNTFFIHDPEGNLAFQYSKVHLFRLLDEHNWFHPGSHFQLAQFPWATAGLAICYDLRFPEVFRQYALQGADLILITAEWPLRRIDHWKVLLRARAIENQVFVAAVNCVGTSGPEIYGGSSAIISPWGETIIEGTSHNPGLLTAEIDLSQVAQVRQSIPVFQDRHPDLYS